MKLDRVKALGRKIPGARWLWRTLKLCSPRYRSEMRLSRERPAGLFQYRSMTSEDRYPQIFSLVRRQLAGMEEPHLLSFGCSTGEEVLTLHRYLPDAWITGIDINRWNVAVARRRLRRAGSRRLRVVHGASPEREPDRVFDAIFCMAVFRCGDLSLDDHPRCDPLLRFADFERVIVDLDRTLKPGGLLAITHANFRFADTSVAVGYDPVMVFRWDAQPKETPLYGPDDRRLPARSPYNDIVFRKRLDGCEGAAGS